MQSSSSRNHSVNHVDAEDQNFPWMQRGAGLGALEARSSCSETGQKDQPHKLPGPRRGNPFSEEKQVCGL